MGSFAFSTSNEVDSCTGDQHIKNKTTIIQPLQKPTIPKYLEEVYWWAYLHPNAVKIFERQWIVEAILWGNYSFLRDVVLEEMGKEIHGRTLQIACAYGNFSQKLLERIGKNGHLDVVDIAEVQLQNLREKVGFADNLALHLQDSTNLQFEDDMFNNVVLFFLLHEQPEEARIQTIKEALRVTKPGGKVTIMDYHNIKNRLNPLRYVMMGVLKTLEPFAMDLWKTDIIHWIPEDCKNCTVQKETYFGGLYQKVTIIK